jgi:sensor domain CHASE-containing protein
MKKDSKKNKQYVTDSSSATTYGQKFLQGAKMQKRGDKSIYISQEYHERLSRIVQVIGKDEIPLYAYLDNILQHHFKLFEKAITDDFNDKFKPIF